MAVIHIQEPKTSKLVPQSKFALFALGFRPFYLLAAIFAFIAIPLWVLFFNQHIALAPVLPGVIWHGHEMLFGFASAVVVGFLLTAVRAWTGLATLSQWPLAALALLWLSARISLLCGPAWLAISLDLLFLPLAAIALGQVLIQSGNRRNYFVLLILAGLTLANSWVYLATFTHLGLSAITGLHLAIALISVLETTIAGRIVPNFTANGLRGVLQNAPIQNPKRDAAAIIFTALTLLAWAFALSPLVTAVLAAIALAIQIKRCWDWRPTATFKTPLLWILHVSHSWLILALALLVWQGVSGNPVNITHWLTIGAMSGLILGMITRTALGHTGHLLQTGKIEFWAYVLLQIALLARVLPQAFAPNLQNIGLWLAATAWSSAFALYLWRYTPILLKARIDGKAG